MITISTRDYTTEQLRDLAEGLFYAANRIFDSPECQKNTQIAQRLVKPMRYVMI